MRVHVSLRDDVRLWGSAVAGAVALFTAIILFGIGPSRFPSFGLGHFHSNRTVVVPRSAASTVLPNHTPTSTTASTESAKRDGKHTPAAGGAEALRAQPKSEPSAQQRPTPSPVKPAHTEPPAAAKPAPASAPAIDSVLPPVPLPPTPDPTTLLPTVPTVTVPPLPDPTNVVPALPLP